jgi:hypothetical protein
MAISSIVVVADSVGIDTQGIQVAFRPGDPYPVRGTVRLRVTGQPFPPPRRRLVDLARLSGPPTRVVPSIVAVHLTYGRLGEGQAPAPLEPDERWLREMTFGASFVGGSWRVNPADASVATLDVTVYAGLRDNTPPGEYSAPDDPFVAFFDVQALCIWTAEPIDLAGLRSSIAQRFTRRGSGP